MIPLDICTRPNLADSLCVVHHPYEIRHTLSPNLPYFRPNSIISHNAESICNVDRLSGSLKMPVQHFMQLPLADRNVTFLMSSALLPFLIRSMQYIVLDSPFSPLVARMQFNYFERSIEVRSTYTSTCTEYRVVVADLTGLP